MVSGRACPVPIRSHLSNHGWVTVQWKVVIHRKPSVPKIAKQEYQYLHGKNGCVLVLDQEDGRL